jgi:hypothetical protein
MILRDSYGWPVELVIGKPVLNAFRRILVTNWRVTWKRRKDGWPKFEADPNVTGSNSTEHDAAGGANGKT